MTSPKRPEAEPVVGDRLHKALYEHPGLKLKNIKFFRGSSDVVTADEMEDAVHSAVLSVRTGRVQKLSEFPETARKPIEASEIIANS